MTHIVIGALGSIGSRQARLLKEAGEEVRTSDVNMPADWKGVDMAWICTPPRVHHEDIFLALNQGIYIFCEKPITDDLKLIETIQEECAKKNGKIFVACNMRFHPEVIKVKEIVDKGEVGDPVYMRFYYSHYLPSQRKNWQESYVMQTGIILDCIHMIDLALWFGGDIENLQGFASQLELPLLDFSRMYITHKKKVLSEIALDFIKRERSCGLEIVGTNKSVSCSIDNTDEMYKNQIKYVLENKPHNLEEHLKVLKVAMEATCANSQR